MTSTPTKVSPTENLYKDILEMYNYFNAALFNNALPQCLITLQRNSKTMGYFSQDRWINSADKSKTDELAVNPEFWLGWPISEVMQTLAHEQCHLWQHHYGKPSHRSYHNKEWAQKMESIGLMPSTTGYPGGKKTGEKMDDYIIADGKFHQAVIKLLDSGYKISWLDTCPSPAPKNYTDKVFNADGRQFTITGDPILAVVDSPSVAQPVSTVTTIGTELAQQGDDAADLQGQLANDGLIKVAAKKQTRVKYRCDGCSSQVWGKPLLEILCQPCNLPYLPVSN